MRVAETVAVPTDAATVASIITRQGLDTVKELILQAPAANVDNIFFGDQTAQPLFIIPGGSAVLDLADLKQTYVVGTGGDNLIVGIPAWDR